MRRYLVIISLLILCISISGCTQFGKSKFDLTTSNPVITASSGNSGVPTTSISYKYSIGDIVKKDPGSSMGRVILNYNPTQGYEWRTIVYDKFSRIHYYESETGTTNFSLFETEYMYKTGHIDNPYDIPELKPEDKPDYKTGDIVIVENNPLEDIIILDYEYTGDTYTYCYASKRSGYWTYNVNDYYKKGRVAIEAEYTKRETGVNL